MSVTFSLLPEVEPDPEEDPVSTTWDVQTQGIFNAYEPPVQGISHETGDIKINRRQKKHN